ncbi:MAG: M90 family metallopeptidase [Treponemataceae bacterium]
MGLFKYFREQRRLNTVKDHPIPDADWNAVITTLSIFSSLSQNDLSRLRNLSTVFLFEKRFLPLQGTVLDSRTKTKIAAEACLPILGLDLDWYSDWKTIIVVPDAYEITRSEMDSSGVIHEYQDELSGEVLHLGPIVLSLTDVERSGLGDGYNVVIHEAAHKIDGKDGDFDGCPPLPEELSYEDWRKAFSEAYERSRNRRVAKRKRHSPRIDEYAEFSPDEFFAVCVESFFETPVILRSDFPSVYALLVRFFKQDSFERLSR